MIKERSKTDVDFENCGDEPFQDFVGILRTMQEAGLVNGVSNYLKKYAVWADRLTGERAAQLAETKRRLLTLIEIEKTHGYGAALDLAHPMVKDLVAWGRLDENTVANAVAFKNLGQS